MQCEIHILHEHHNVYWNTLIFSTLKNTRINDYSNTWILHSLKTHLDILFVWSTDSATICVIYGARHVEIFFLSSSKIFLIYYQVAKEYMQNKCYTSYTHINIRIIYCVYIQWKKIHLLYSQTYPQDTFWTLGLEYNWP